jgi:hypothetical protein
VNHDVTVTFSWDGQGTETDKSADCHDGNPFTVSSPTTLTCQVTNADSSTSSLAVSVTVDQQAPIVTPTPSRAPDSNGWFNHPFDVGFAGTDPSPGSGILSCAPAVHYDGPDGAALSVAGGCTDNAGNTGGAEYDFKYDATKPTMAAPSASPGAAPSGWFTGPVTWTFPCHDTTSGAPATVTAPTYVGPDSGSASVTASCTDAAGNTQTRSVAFKYDATPPAPAQLFAAASDGSVALSWTPASDAASFTLTRSNGGPATTIFTGSAHNFVDTSVQNGTRYTYTLSSFDAAGNSSNSSVFAVPSTTAPVSSTSPGGGSAPVVVNTPPPGTTTTPAISKGLTRPPLLKWKRVAGARYYNLQIYRGKKKILSIWPKQAHFRLRSHWRYNGHRHRLTKGTYTWYVWPGFGPTSKHNYGALLGQSAFRMA